MENRRLIATKLHVYLASVCFGMFLIACVSCSSDVDPVLASIKKDQQLIVLTLNSPTTYYIDRDREAGPEYDMGSAFAQTLDASVNYKVFESIGEIWDALSRGEGHIAAAGLTETPTRNKRFLPAAAYQAIQQQVVCHRDGPRPRDIDDLSTLSLAVVARSSYAEYLRKLKRHNPSLYWVEKEDATSESMLEDVSNKTVDCTISDSNIVAVNRRYHPELIVSFNLNNPEYLVWYLPHDAVNVKTLIDDWLVTYNTSGQLNEMLERYYGFADKFDYVDTRKFVDRIEKRLPKYLSWFRTAGQQHDIPWTLLAALSYQESHWNPKAKSPTGVRGIMMLTQATARDVGVTNRLDPRPNIFGGAKYLAALKRRLPNEIPEPTRTWFALAAYNVGIGHFYDARKLAKQLGKDPNSWADMKRVLPLLSQPHYFKQTRYGYARGNEPVFFVDRVRDFEHILNQLYNETPRSDEPVQHTASNEQY